MTIIKKNQVDKAVLTDAKVPLEMYDEYVGGLCSIVRELIAGDLPRYRRLEWAFDTLHHEDGSRGILIQICSDVDGESLDRLDEAILVYASDIERWGPVLPSLVTTLVRDIPAQSEQESV